MLHTVGYDDGDRERPVLYRASLSEMVVPYGDPAPTHRPQERLRRRRVQHRDAGQLARARLRLPRARSTTSTRVLADGDGNAATRSRTPSACTRRTTACSGSTPTSAPRRSRSAGRAGWWSRSSPPSATTSTASSGTSTRTARSSSRSSSPGSCPPARSPPGTSAHVRPAPQRRRPLRPDPPALLQHAARLRRRRHGQLGLRGRHRDRARRARTTRSATPSAPADACCGPSEARSGDVDPGPGPLLEGRQSGGHATPSASPSATRSMPHGDRRAVRAARRQRR